MLVLFLQLELKLFEDRTYTTVHNFPSYSIGSDTELNIIKSVLFNTCVRKFSATHTPRAASGPASLLQSLANDLWCVNQKLTHTGAERHLTSHSGFEEAWSTPWFLHPFLHTHLIPHLHWKHSLKSHSGPVLAKFLQQIITSWRPLRSSSCFGQTTLCKDYSLSSYHFNVFNIPKYLSTVLTLHIALAKLCHTYDFNGQQMPKPAIFCRTQIFACLSGITTGVPWALETQQESLWLASGFLFPKPDPLYESQWRYPFT